MAFVGNPHVVVRDDPKWTDAMREELAEKLSVDMDGANVEFLTVEDDAHLSIKVIERGVGWTRACGTGSCAVAAVAHREAMCGADVTVDNPGGALHVTLGRRRRDAGRPGAVHRQRGVARSVTYIPTTLIDRSFREKIVLVGVQFPGVSEDELDYQLDELALLVDTAGADVVARVVQRRDSPDPATFLGSGKVQELREICLALDSDTVVFEHNLSPAQQRNLEKILGRTAIDRTAVILDIFAQNARTPEGKAQVELALLQYRLPRLRRAGGSLSQQAGGIGTRGPGETQLETDRRRLVNRIHAIKRELKEIDRTRGVQRHGRARGRHREVTLVGYTNAGKSSMLNAITDAGVEAEDRLFVTLDPRTRQRQLAGGETVLFTDTVGFISNLPHDLVEAFMSTLKSVQLADLLVHVVDGANDHAEEQIAAVREVLREIDADHVPELLVFNKADVPGSRARELAKLHEGSVWVSAVTHENLDAAIATIGDRLRVNDRVVTLHLPLDRGDLLARAHREGEVVDTSITEDSVVVRVLLDSVSVAHFDEWRVPA